MKFKSIEINEIESERLTHDDFDNNDDFSYFDYCTELEEFNKKYKSYRYNIIISLDSIIHSFFIYYTKDKHGYYELDVFTIKNNKYEPVRKGGYFDCEKDTEYFEVMDSNINKLKLYRDFFLNSIPVLSQQLKENIDSGSDDTILDSIDKKRGVLELVLLFINKKINEKEEEITMKYKKYGL